MASPCCNRKAGSALASLPCQVRCWASGGEDPWHIVLESVEFPHLFATQFDLTNMSLVDAMEGDEDRLTIVEFYSPSCPHCRHFYPEFERLAMTASLHDHGVSVASVDCVRFGHTCADWGINAYPTLLVAPRSQWVLSSGAGGKDSIVKASNGGEHTGGESAERVARWLQRNTGVDLQPWVVPKEEFAAYLQKSAVAWTANSSADAEQATKGNAWDAQVAAALFLRKALSVHSFLSEAGPGDILLDFMDVLARRFPETSGDSSCRASLSNLVTRVREDWSSLTSRSGLDEDRVRINPDTVEAEWQLCDTPWDDYTAGWRSCKGTVPGTRGFTCGLWTLLHSLAAQGEDAEAQHDLNATRSALGEFFDCVDCREHFMKIPFDSSDGQTKRNAQLWWWRAHNIVNMRVEEIEKDSGDGDPAFPKVMWPTSDICRACRKSQGGGVALLNMHLRQRVTPQRLRAVQFKPLDTATIDLMAEEWDEDEVVAFLTEFYG